MHQKPAHAVMNSAHHAHIYTVLSLCLSHTCMDEHTHTQTQTHSHAVNSIVILKQQDVIDQWEVWEPE